MKYIKILNGKRFSFFCIFCVSFVLMTIFQNCDVRQPKVENLSMMSVSYVHPTPIISCQACHEKDRPSTVGSITHPSKSDSSIYSLSGSDPMDCIKCHDGAQNKGSWKNISLISDYHINATSCSSCHGSGGVADRTSFYINPGSSPDASAIGILLGGGHPNSNLMIGKDCFSCHTQPVTSSRTTVIKDWLLGLKIETGIHSLNNNCNECHDAGKQYDRNQFMSALAPIVEPFFSGGHALTTGVSCQSCHTSGIKAKDWSDPAYLKLSNFHSSATNCSLCHGSASRKDRVIFQKMGPTSATSSGVGGNQTFTMTNFGGHPSESLITSFGVNDCKTCHSYQTSSSFGSLPSNWAWNEFSLDTSFHKSSNFPAKRCDSCHGKGQQFDRTIIIKSTHTGGAPESIVQDCFSCHGTGNQISSWVSNSNFSHPTTYSSGGSNKYCYECHTAPAFIKLPPSPAKKDGMVSLRRILSGHLGAEASSSTLDCSSCHTIPSSTVSGWVQTDASGNVTSYPHKAINWLTGNVSTINNCQQCHESTNQSINVYKTEAGVSVFKGEIPISNLNLSATELSTLQNRIGHYTNAVGSNCTTCHSIPTVKQQWEANHPTFTGDCNTCHIKAPSSLVSKSGSHPSVNSGGLCAGCHGGSTKNWADGKAMDHSGTTSCTSCHNFVGSSYTSPSGKITGSIVQSFSVSYSGNNLNESFTHNTTTNCSTCHITPTVSETNFTNTWVNYSHKQFNNNTVTDKSCLDCHGKAVSNKILPSAGSRNPHTHTAFNKGQCGMCHYPSSSGGWSGRKDAAHNTFKGKGVYSCSYCHN